MPPIPPWEIVRDQFLYLIFPAFFASLIVALILGAIRKTRPAAIPLAILAGLAAPNLIEHRVDWWSRDYGWYSLFPATAMALLVGAGLNLAYTALVSRRKSLLGDEELSAPQPRKADLVFLGVFALMTILIISFWVTPIDQDLFGQIPRRITVLMTAGVILASTLVLGAVWNLTFPKWGMSLLGILWGGAASVIMIHAHSLVFTDLAIAMSNAMLGSGLASMVYPLLATDAEGQSACRKRQASLFSTVGNWIGPAIYFPALAMGAAGNTFSELPLATFVLVGALPLGLLIFLIPKIWPQQPRLQQVLVLIVAAIPAAIAVILAVMNESISVG